MKKSSDKIFGKEQAIAKRTTVIMCIVAILVGVVICDQINSRLLKETVQRPRPCHIMADINLLVPCGAGKSFPSSHAANSMMAVTVIAMFYRKHKY